MIQNKMVQPDTKRHQKDWELLARNQKVKTGKCKRLESFHPFACTSAVCNMKLKYITNS